MRLRMLILLLKLSFWLLFASAYAETTAEIKLSGAKPGCQTTCGKLTVPFPFGVGIECARSEGLYVACDSTYKPPKPFLTGNNLEILGISATELRIKNNVAFRCYNESGYATKYSTAWISLGNKHYTFSDKSNMFVSVGCNTIAFIEGRDYKHYTSGCVTMCRTKASVLNGSCSGIGCCRTSIPKGLDYFKAYIGKPSNLDSEPFSFSPCSYAFLADQNKFQFRASDIGDMNFFNRTMEVPIMLDWVVDNVTCEVAQRNLKDFACQNNTVCNDSDNGPGYRCKCREGYKGNPYLSPGCQDINECEDTSKKQCLSNANCINVPGTYLCTCPPGTHGDGRKNSAGCLRESSKDFHN